MTDTLTPVDRLTIVKHLAGGKTLEFTAAATGHTAESIRNIGASHGYPDTVKLAHWVGVLTRNLETAARATIPAGMPAVTSLAPRQVPAAWSTVRVAPRDQIADLIAAGNKSTRARTRAMTARVTRALTFLTKELDAEAARTAASAVAAAAEARVRTEVAHLEEELAAKRALLSKSRAASGSACVRAGLDPAVVHAWVKKNGVDCGDQGRIPNRVVDAYLTAHPGV